MIPIFRAIDDLSVFTTAPADRKPNRFRVDWPTLVAELDYEIEALETTEAHLGVVLADPFGGILRDGTLSARAKVTHPGCVLTLVTKHHGTLVYPCDAFEGRHPSDPPDWRINLRAISLGLTALRRLDDYGITARGQQYAGFRELGTGTAIGDSTVYDRRGLARFLAQAAGLPDDELDLDPDDLEAVEQTYRRAARAHHPDRGGNPQMMTYLNTARDTLAGLAGGRADG